MFVSFTMPMFLANMGTLLAAQSKHVDGEEALRLSLLLKPGSDNPSHAGLAIVLAQLGRLREAAIEAKIGLESIEKLDHEMSKATESTRAMSGYDGPDTELRSHLEGIVRASETAGD